MTTIVNYQTEKLYKCYCLSDNWYWICMFFLIVNFTFHSKNKHTKQEVEQVKDTNLGRYLKNMLNVFMRIATLECDIYIIKKNSDDCTNPRVDNFIILHALQTIIWVNEWRGENKILLANNIRFPLYWRCSEKHRLLHKTGYFDLRKIWGLWIKMVQPKKYTK